MAAHVVKAYCDGSLSVISKSFWQGVLSACSVSNVSLVFGVNYAVGTPGPTGPNGDRPPVDASWDPALSGFTELLKFTAETTPTVVSHYELGNEPRSGKFGYDIPSKTMAKNCAHLKAMVKAAYASVSGVKVVPKVVCGDFENNDEPGSKPKHGKTPEEGFWKPIIDPFVSAVTAPFSVAETADDTVDNSGSADALSLHWCKRTAFKFSLPFLVCFTASPFILTDFPCLFTAFPCFTASLCVDPASSHDKHDAKEILNASRLDSFRRVFKRFGNKIAPDWRAAGGEVWAGETASLQNGGGDGVSNRFQSTTWLYDQLGMQGEVGVSRMMRESFSCSRYAMMTGDGAPHPDFFSTMVWRQVVGSKVLAPMVNDTRTDKDKTLRVYARCAKQSRSKEVVLVVVNFSPDSAASLTLTDATAGSKKQEWLLTAGNANESSTNVWDWGRSDDVRLNGELLALTLAGEAPVMAPRVDAAGDPVVLAPLSVALVQYSPKDGAAACLDDERALPHRIKIDDRQAGVEPPRFVGRWAGATQSLPAIKLPQNPLLGNGHVGILLDSRITSPQSGRRAVFTLYNKTRCGSANGWPLIGHGLSLKNCEANCTASAKCAAFSYCDEAAGAIGCAVPTAGILSRCFQFPDMNQCEAAQVGWTSGLREPSPDPSPTGGPSNITLDLWFGSNSLWAVNACPGPTPDAHHGNTNRSAPFNPRWAPP